MDNSSGLLIKMKRDNFRVDLRKKDREKTFKANREYFLQKFNSNLINDENQFDLNALNIAKLTVEELQAQIEELIDYMNTLDEKIESEKLFDSLAKLKILSTKYLNFEKVEDRIYSQNMTILFQYLNLKKFLGRIIILISPEVLENIEMVGPVFDILQIINNLLMGRKVVPEIIHIEKLVLRLIKVANSKYDQISVICFEAFANIIQEDDLNTTNYCLGKEELIETFQIVLSRQPSAMVKQSASFCINSICAAITKNRSFFNKHPLIDHLISFIGYLIPDPKAVNSLYILISRNGNNDNADYSLKLLEQFRGLFTKLVSIQQNLTLQRQSKENLSSINQIFNLLTYLTSLDDMLLVEILIEIGLIDMHQTIIDKSLNSNFLEPVFFQLSNLSCSQNGCEYIVQRMLPQLFELSQSNLSHLTFSVKLNIILTIFNLFQTAEWSHYNIFVQLGLDQLIIMVLNNYSNTELVKGALLSLKIYFNYLFQEEYWIYNNQIYQRFIQQNGSQTITKIHENSKNCEIQELCNDLINQYFSNSIQSE